MTRQFPIGKQVKLAQMDVNPYPTFKQMLSDEPVSWIDEIGMWYVIRREDVLRILADTEIFTVVSDKSLMRQAVGYNMITTDGSEQTRLRRPFAGEFAPRGLRAFAIPFVEALSHSLIDDFADGEIIDLKTDFADIIAIQTVLEILGLSATDYTVMRGWVSDFAAIMSNFSGDVAIIERGKKTVREFSEYVLQHVDVLRKNPNDTILGRMVQDDSHQLSDDEIVDAIRVIIFGGVETTSALITNTMWCLCTHPEQLKQVRGNLDLLPNAIEESLRYESPVQTCTRHVLADVEVAGVTLKTGDTLQCMLGAANRDLSYFVDADAFDINRENARDHLAFANGKHFCIGAGLARMEADVSIRVLLERLPMLALLDAVADAPRGYEFRSSHQLRIKRN